MSLCGTPSFVAGNEDLDLHHLFAFTNNPGAVKKETSQSPDDLPAVPRLASPFAGPCTDIQVQPVGWPSPAADGSADCLETFNFNDFLALDEGNDDLLVVVEQCFSPPPPETTKVSTTFPGHINTTTEHTEKVSVATELDFAQAEIAQLKAALAVESPQHKLLTAPAGHLTSSSPRKRKSISGEVSPSKRLSSTQMGPIEAMWSSGVTEDERRAFRENFASPTTPSPQAHLDFTPQAAAAYIRRQRDFEISPEDLLSMQQFLRDNNDLIHSTSQQVSISTTTPNADMAPCPGNVKANRTARKHAPRSSAKVTTDPAAKITKKKKVAPRKTKHKLATSVTALPTTPPEALAIHRGIEELLALNFYSLNEQEKGRVLLPMLRGLDPKELEASLAQLPCIQAKGPGHHVRVARAIRNSPPTPEADADLAVKLTTGTPPSPTPFIKTFHSSSPAPEASPSFKEVAAGFEMNEDHGTVRQREALEKAALLQAHGKKR
ncbi:uncharacterized protein EKO05_0002873 [Ascochyta rabiei]|uniref:Uncharacterized protein n=1 Tax=Didymella rabiei TaxID=5454 RepID=A0A163L0H1_DIDRA|nr:uncharacterized protein EKO05_0002873 [Ascochyta rabiei]KZM27400.1 hypothetical protein ST47_g1442 [Ascochyta rabiei]UPX12319.1 hypothetical protein EKO05_0002873 [Ascochyta rabiei]